MAMEGHGTGGEIDFRVGRLEARFETLHSEMQTSFRESDRRLDSLAAFIEKMDSKLDAQRTKKPEWQALATLAGVVVVVFGLAFAPVYFRLEAAERHIESVQAVQHDRAEIIGDASARLELLERYNFRLDDKVTDLHRGAQ